MILKQMAEEEEETTLVEEAHLKRKLEMEMRAYNLKAVGEKCFREAESGG